MSKDEERLLKVLAICQDIKELRCTTDPRKGAVQAIEKTLQSLYCMRV